MNIMLLPSFVRALFWSLTFSFVTANSPVDLAVRSINPASEVKSLQAIKRALSLVERDTVFQNSTSLDKSWNGAVLFS